MISASARLLLASLLLNGFETTSARVTRPHTINRRLVTESSPLPIQWSLDAAQPVSLTEYTTIQLGLTQSNPKAIEPTLLSVSDPESSSYGKYLSQDQVLAFVEPDPDTTSTVKTWLAAHNVTGYIIAATKDWYTLNITVGVANSLLGTDFQAYFNDDEYGRILRAQNYSLPADVFSAIETIQPTTAYLTNTPSRRRAHRKRAQKQHVPRDTPLSPSQYTNCTNTGLIPPWCVRELYNVGNYTPTVREGNSVAIAGYLENYAQHSDLQQYLELYLPEAASANYTFSVTSVFDTPVPQDDVYYGNTEANLDTQMVAGLVYPIPSTFYSVAGRGSLVPDRNTELPTNEPYMDLINYLLGLPDSDLPSVLTTSYGDDEQSVSYEYASRVCRGYAALGIRGVTVVFSSADQGVGPADYNEANNFCLTNDGTGRTTFIPNFPSSCWAVTTVGDTNGVSPEVASSQSGGGFSQYFPRPTWQDKQVEAYLEYWGPTYASFFNQSGRAFPDVAAQGSQIPMYNEGQFNIVYGTSAAAPMVASLFALLNDYRLSNGHPRLGFINPLLYSSKAQNCYHDMLNGTNPGCGTNGFNATTGWDPVSGLGTLDFQSLMDIVVPK